MRGSRPGPSGLTLIEVVVAMAILTVGLLVLLAGFAEGGRAQRTATLHTRAVILAQGLLDERLAAGELEAGSEEGEFDRQAGFRWRLEVTPVESPRKKSDAPSLLEVRLTTSWPDAGREASLQLATIVPGPGE